jgi:hypothetical protein
MAACDTCPAGRFVNATATAKQRPVVPRLRNVNATGFEVFAQAADTSGKAGLSATASPSVTMNCLAGVWGALPAVLTQPIPLSLY